LKLCKDCKHFQGVAAARECTASQNEKRSPDYVNGGEIIDYTWFVARFARQSSAHCGPDAAWFEPREIEPLVQKAAA
jgi:hypothetical protein